jgi:hypothetical protein
MELNIRMDKLPLTFFNAIFVAHYVFVEKRSEMEYKRGIDIGF